MYKFAPTNFEPADAYDADAATLANVRALRAHHPELQAWSDLALVCAFGDYSTHIMAVHWADWLCNQRDEAFLAYLYVRAISPGFRFDATGLHMDDVDEYSKNKPWLTGEPAPAWASARE